MSEIVKDMTKLVPIVAGVVTYNGAIEDAVNYCKKKGLITIESAEIMKRDLQKKIGESQSKDVA